MIDPSIPLRVEGFNLSDILNDAQGRQARQMQMDEYRRKQTAEQEKAGALSDLIASRGPNGSYDTKGPAFQRFTQADPSAAFEMLGKMDEQQRKAAEAGIKDIAAAVQWADSPEKWQVVQRHYGQFDPQLAAVPFENREQALIQLGQMGAYLEQTKPEIKAIEAGGSLAAVDPRTGRATPLILPNDGSQPAYGASGVQEGATATNPQTGEKIMFRGGQWVPVGGGGGNVTGNFLDGL